MSRGKSTSSTIVVNKTGQTTLTIPRALAAAMGLDKGKTVEWKVAGLNKLEIQLKK